MKSPGCVSLREPTGRSNQCSSAWKISSYPGYFGLWGFHEQEPVYFACNDHRKWERVEQEQDRSNSSVNEYCIVNFHSIQEGEVLFINNPEVFQFLSYLLMILYLNLKYLTSRVFGWHWRDLERTAENWASVKVNSNECYSALCILWGIISVVLTVPWDLLLRSRGFLSTQQNKKFM